MTHPNAERVTLTNLARQGYDSFAPKFRSVVVENGRRVSRSGYMFSRYVFVWVQDQWRSISSTRGVARLFMIDERPALLSFEDEARLLEMRAAMDGDGFVDLNAGHRFKRGDHVHVESGPFAGFDGIYSGMSAQQREVVLLNMLGRVVPVELPQSALA